MSAPTTRWDWSGPEEGDGDDTVVIMFDGEEVMTVPHDGRAWPIRVAKGAAERICIELNRAEVVTI